MGARSVDSTGMETGMDGDADSTGWIGVISGVTCAKTTEFCDGTCVKVGMTFALMDVSYIIWQGENQTMPDKVKGHTESLASINEILALSSKNVSYM